MNSKSDRIKTSHRGLFLLAVSVLLSLWLLASLSFALSQAGASQVEDVAWRNFSPSTWIDTSFTNPSIEVVSTIPMTIEKAQYQISLVGGTQWGNWQLAMIEHNEPLTWTLQANNVQFAAGQENRIRFSITDTLGNYVVSEPYTVSVDPFPPTLRITEPAAGRMISSEHFLIRGDVADKHSRIDRVQVTAGNEILTASLALPIWSLTWTVPSGDGVFYSLTAQAFDKAHNAISETITVTVDTAPPSNLLVITETHGITNGASVIWEDELEFVWDELSDGSGIAGYQVYWGPDPKGVSETITTTTRYVARPLTLLKRHFLRILAMDGAGNRSDWIDAFNVRRIPITFTFAMPLIVDQALFSDIYEPNDTFSQAHGPLEFDRRYAAFIAPDGDQDYYFVEIASPTNSLTISLTNIPEGADYDLYLYQANIPLQLVASSAQYGNVDEQIEYANPKLGRYYIRVYPMKDLAISSHTI